MLGITKKITLDFYNKNPVIIHIKQNDKNSRLIEVMCNAQSENVYLKESNHIAYLRAKLPNGNCIFKSCTISQKGNILIHLDGTIASVKGNVTCDLIVVERNRDDNNIFSNEKEFRNAHLSVVSTMLFYIDVVGVPVDEETIIANSDFSALADMLEKANRDYTQIISTTSTALTQINTIKNDVDKKYLELKTINDNIEQVSSTAVEVSSSVEKSKKDIQTLQEKIVSSMGILGKTLNRHEQILSSVQELNSSIDENKRQIHSDIEIINNKNLESQKYLSQLNSSIELAKTSKSNLENTIETSSTSKTELDKSIGIANGLNTALSDLCRQANDCIDSTDVVIKNAKNNTEKLKEQIGIFNSLDEKLKNAKHKLDEYNTMMESLNSSETSLNEKLQSKSTELQQLINRVGEINTQLESKVNELKDRIVTDSKQQIDTIQNKAIEEITKSQKQSVNRISELTNQFSEFATSKKEELAQYKIQLTKEIDSTKDTTIQELNTTKTAIVQSINSAKTQAISEITKNQGELQQAISNATTKKDELNEKINNAESLSNNLDNANKLAERHITKDIPDKIKSLDEKIQECNSVSGSLDSKIQSGNEVVRNANSKIQELKTNIETANQKIEELKNASVEPLDSIIKRHALTEEIYTKNREKILGSPELLKLLRQYSDKWDGYNNEFKTKKYIGSCLITEISVNNYYSQSSYGWVRLKDGTEPNWDKYKGDKDLNFLKDFKQPVVAFRSDSDEGDYIYFYKLEQGRVAY